MRGAKTRKLRPRGVRPRVEVKGLQSIVKNCCQHFGRSNTAKGVRRSAAQKQQPRNAAESGAKQHKQQPRNSEGCPAEGGPAEGPRRLGPRRVWPRSVGAPKGGGSPDLEKLGPPEGGGLKISRFFFLLPPPFSFFFSLSGCLLVSFFLSLGFFSWNFGGVLVGRDLQCLFSPSGCPVEPRRPAASSSKTLQKKTKKKKKKKKKKKQQKAVQTLWKVKSGNGVSSPTTPAAKRPECGGAKTEKLRPRGVRPRVEVKGLQSIVKNCCQHFGRSNTARWWWRGFDGRRPKNSNKKSSNAARIGLLWPRPAFATTCFGHGQLWAF